MEEKINIAAILKDKSQGTKLYDWLHNIDIELDIISTTDTETVVWCTNETNNNTTCHRGYSEFGTERGYPDGLQILFPSKKMCDWAKFSWKKGDVLSCGVDNICIFEKWENEEYTEFYAKFVTPNYSGNTFKTEKWSKETNEAVIKQYISNIEEFKGGKLNLTTLEIEKTQPEFKDGDILLYKSPKFTFFSSIFILDTNRMSSYVRFSIGKGSIDYDVKVYNLYTDRFRLATEKEKQQLFEALAKEGKAWDAEKKEVVNLKPKCEFKPFDKVVVRCSEADRWSIDFFSHKVHNGYICTGDAWFGYCLPYNEETSHLLGTTDEWKGGEG